MKNFVKETMARLVGDTDEALALRNERKAHAAIKSQVSGLESKVVDAEVTVEEKALALSEARYPSTPITNAVAYLQGIEDAKEELAVAKEELEDLKAAIQEWKVEMGVLFSGE